MTPINGKRSWSDENKVLDEQPLLAKRRRSRSLSSDINVARFDSTFFEQRQPVPTIQELDRLNRHIGLQEFGAELQKAANIVFTGNHESRYTKVEVMLLSWEDEDPKLPVSLEIRELASVFTNLYQYEVQEWQIPAEDSHIQLQ